MRTSLITDKKELEEIISACDICFVGIVDGVEAPYVIPMNFGYADGEILLHSGPHGKHLELLTKNNRISVTFCTERKLKYQDVSIACSYSMQSRSVLCQGTVSFVDDNNLEEKEQVLNVFMKNYSDKAFKYSDAALRNVKVWRVSVDKMTGKSFGQNFKS